MAAKFPYLRIEVTDDGQVRQLNYRRTVLDPDGKKAVLGPVAGADIGVVQTRVPIESGVLRPVAMGEGNGPVEVRILFAGGTRASVRISKLNLWFHRKQLQDEVNQFKQLAGPTLFEQAMTQAMDWDI